MKKPKLTLEMVQENPLLISDTPLASNPIDAWSFSRYNLYSQCPYKFKLTHIDKVQTPKPPAMARGNAIHKLAANYLTGEIADVPKEMETRTDVLTAIRGMNPFVEQRWAYDSKWRPTKYFQKTGPKQTWLRGSLDAGYEFMDTEGKCFEAVDWKTGKKYGSNEEQMELFALIVMVRFPDIKRVDTRLAYVDMPAGPDSEIYASYSGTDAAPLKAKWEAKAAPMFNDTLFAPRQNKMCHFCDFNRSNGGPCRYG